MATETDRTTYTERLADSIPEFPTFNFTDKDLQPITGSDLQPRRIRYSLAIPVLLIVIVTLFFLARLAVPAYLIHQARSQGQKDREAIVAQAQEQRRTILAQTEQEKQANEATLKSQAEQIKNNEARIQGFPPTTLSGQATVNSNDPVEALRLANELIVPIVTEINSKKGWYYGNGSKVSPGYIQKNRYIIRNMTLETLNLLEILNKVERSRGPGFRAEVAKSSPKIQRNFIDIRYDNSRASWFNGEVLNYALTLAQNPNISIATIIDAFKTGLDFFLQPKFVSGDSNDDWNIDETIAEAEKKLSNLSK